MQIIFHLVDILGFKVRMDLLFLIFGIILCSGKSLLSFVLVADHVEEQFLLDGILTSTAKDFEKS